MFARRSYSSFRAREHLFQSEDAIEWLAQLLEALEMGHRVTLFGIAFIGLLRRVLKEKKGVSRLRRRRLRKSAEADDVPMTA
jgi:hypothetical protein